MYLPVFCLCGMEGCVFAWSSFQIVGARLQRQKHNQEKKIELRWLSGVVTSSAENVRSSLRSRSTVLSYKQKVMEKGDMVSNDSKSYFQMRKPNVWPLQEIVGLSVGDGSQSSVLIKDEADE